MENPPFPSVDPESRTLTLLKGPAFLALSDLAQPELRLAGLRLNPRNHNAARTRPFSSFALQDVASGQPIALASLPAGLAIEYPGYSPTGQHLAFVEVREQGMALWLVDLATGQARRVSEPVLFPNVHLRTFSKGGGLKAVTAIFNPYQALDGVKKEIIKYKRADGVELSATLHLPPGYDPARDGKLPVVMEAYPTEFKDAKSAGQLRESPHAFTRPYWGSPIYWTLRGYAVLENTQFPIVGQGKVEPNDTYVEQLVLNAQAAIEEVDRRGVGDPKRVACIGHSYGAFMVANLLAHSSLFAAGIARSGAYNRSLTPFGFQAEERTYWQAPEVYHRMSPFDSADKIKTPLLLVHGDADNNPGTFTLQSERLFQAVKGLGGRARLVLLPLESHGYAARENLLHMLWEQDTWLEKWVKGGGK